MYVLYTTKKDNNADIQKYNLFLSFPSITQNVHMGRVRKRVENSWDAHTGVSMNLQWTASSSFPHFARLVQCHFKTLNHLGFYLLLNFCESRTDPSQGNTCVVFTLGNRCSPSYVTLTTYAACQRDLLVNIQHTNVFYVCMYLCLCMYVYMCGK